VNRPARALGKSFGDICELVNRILAPYGEHRAGFPAFPSVCSQTILPFCCVSQFCVAVTNT
jgi:hypothetical protein